MESREQVGPALGGEVIHPSVQPPTAARRLHQRRMRLADNAAGAYIHDLLEPCDLGRALSSLNAASAVNSRSAVPFSTCRSLLDSTTSYANSRSLRILSLTYFDCVEKLKKKKIYLVIGSRASNLCLGVVGDEVSSAREPRRRRIVPVKAQNEKWQLWYGYTVTNRHRPAHETDTRQGCCQSTSNTSPYESPRPSAAPGHDPSLPRDSSRAAITQSSRSLRRDGDSQHPTSSTLPPNHRIRAPSPLNRSPKNVSNMPPPWTRSHLEREREAFFETRVTGRSEVWNALDIACQMIRSGELAEAQGILDAVGATVPTGKVSRGRGRDRLRGGVYDEKGALYEIPDWIVADPRDLIEDAGTEKEIDGENDDEDDDEDWEGGVPVDSSAEDKEVVRPKGKGRAEDIGDEVKLRARLSDRGTDVEVTLGSKQPVRIALQRIREQTGVNRVRLVYMGKPMEEGRTLADCGWRSGQVVNAFVFEGDEKFILEKTKGSKGR
ncbi:hypothetical protein M409DRAFT_50849 [Zasmidium cellare ATCC 36951]|uniref:Ubiquitin-like domain-containing protein n=1 Tax=Zasmidium cellare ATCC 36951 TaxID=1080233 RepID=A0A6A6CXG9_ZASCE|nr:uncharacterized protein M409DRAFT_50849 [Zasmidium cellare ATCC 36951]KAF2171403.1 hypothetical protein M409DRAFT_50849 [Zasmidium cellare ATCC 36951]